MRARYCFSKMQIYKSENHLYLVCLLSLAVRNVKYLIQTPERILFFPALLGALGEHTARSWEVVSRGQVFPVSPILNQ